MISVTGGVFEKDYSCELEEIIGNAENGETVILPEGKVFLSHRVWIKNKKNITLKGNSTTLITDFSPETGTESHKGALGFDGCEGVTLKNIVFDSARAVNATVEVISTGEDKNTVDAAVCEGCTLDGGQTIRAINTMDKDGSPDGIIASYGKTEYEPLGENRVRIFMPENLRSAVSELKAGQKLCLRFGVGGFAVLDKALLVFYDCNDTVLEDITVHSSVGYATVVFPRCKNFTLIRYNVLCPENSGRLMASNVDAVHLLGLSGKLTVKDCYFDGLGDDAVNIHSAAACVTEIKDKKAVLENARFKTPMPDNFCTFGDRLKIYDKSFAEKGCLEVEEYLDSTVTYKNLHGTVNVGDTVGNTEFYAETEITGCTVKNSRARGFLLQSENITVDNCKFFGILLPAVLLSPDALFWQEAGPIKNAQIKNCVFEKCTAAFNPCNDYVIAVRTSHERHEPPDAFVHENITVKNNRFINTKGNEIGIFNVKGLEIKNNTNAFVQTGKCRF